MKQIISVIVENRYGVLNRVTNLFSRRAFNIESLAVGITDDPSVSRITMIVDSGNNEEEQVEKQLNKMVDVIKVRSLSNESSISRELMLIKVSANNKNRDSIMTICQIMGAKICDMTPTTMTMEISDTSERVESFEEMLKSYNILEICRTGTIALQKGSGKI